jgi:integrase
MRKIRPLNNNGSIQLRVKVLGKTYRLNPIPGGSYDNPSDIEEATMIGQRMAQDLKRGCFDTTLEKYRVALPKPQEATDLLSLWDKWVATLDLPEHTLADHYRYTRRQIEKSLPGLLDTLWFTRCGLAASTYNSRLGSLRKCLAWSISEGYASTNPWDKVSYRKSKRKPIKVFSDQELKAVLEGFLEYHPHFYPMVYFLAATGVRFSEAVGITWEHIDFDRGTIDISESLTRDMTGNGYRRIRKSTKTGSIRELPMSPRLKEMLREHRRTRPRGLVFRSKRGKVVNYQGFSDAWRDTLERQGVPYRKIHTLRHNCLSLAIEQGTPITGVAYLAGHSSTQMVMTTYGHMINRPDLPDLGV